MIGEWASQFNLSVKRCEDRPDNPPGDVVYRLKDLFTTRDGSWDPKNTPGTVPQWARDAYLRPGNAPDYFDDAGGDHHLFARVLDVNGQPVKDQELVRYWSDGFDCLGDSGYNGYVNMTPKEKSGWANVVIFDHFAPDRGQQGAWCWCPNGAADVVVGGGLPYKLHVSFFAVWQAELRHADDDSGDAGTVVIPPTEPADPGFAPLEDLRRQGWDLLGVNYNRDSAFANYARVHGLGGPLTNEYDMGGYRAQGFVGGIVYATVGQWHNIEHMAW